jgi:hypothetical protein
MVPANRPAGSDAGYDPYFQVTDVGLAKELAPSTSDAERARRPFRRRMTVLGVVLAVVWIGVLLDPGIAGLALLLLAGIGVALGLVGAAMALGLLGFGLGIAGDRFIAWLRRGSRWPEE